MKKSLKLLAYKVGFQFLDLNTPAPAAVLYFGKSVGDDLLLTVVARQLRRSGYRSIWVKTHFPELFFYNSDFNRIVDLDNYRTRDLAESYIESRALREIQPHYTNYDPESDRDRIPDGHILRVMCQRAGVAPPEKLCPVLHLSENEIRQGRYSENQIAIQSSIQGSANPIPLKDWYPERFQELTSLLSPEFTVIQLGTEHDPPLPGVVDLRGKTSLREAAAVLANSKVFIGLVGFLMHLARAVNCPSVIIYGGRESPEQSGYSENINIARRVECSPCWLRSRCPHEQYCMESIPVSEVRDGVYSLLQR